MTWKGWDDYAKGWPIADSLNAEGAKRQIFSVSVLGFQTHRDDFAIAFEKVEIEARIRDMRDQGLSDAALKERHGIEDKHWNLKGARAAVAALSMAELAKRQTECSYRPFDSRPSFFGEEIMDRPRRELLDHVAGRGTLQLLVSRQIGSEHWRHALVGDQPPNDCVVSDASSEANYCFPIHLFIDGTKRDNHTVAFRAFLDERYDHHYSAEEIFGYIYAILHAAVGC